MTHFPDFHRSVSVALGVLGAGVLLVMGLLSGIWKYYAIMASERARAPYYVDICHRAALMYSFAALVLAALAGFSVWPETINVWAMCANLLYFVLAIGSYALHGLLKDTDNQFRSPHVIGPMTLPGVLMHAFMGTLILAELGGTLVLLWGAAKALLPVVGLAP